MKLALCQLCRYIREPGDRLGEVKSNIAYCSDCNVHLKVELLQSVSLSGGFIFEIWNEFVAPLPLLKKRLKSGIVHVQVREDRLEGMGTPEKGGEKKENKREAAQEFMKQHMKQIKTKRR